MVVWFKKWPFTTWTISIGMWHYRESLRENIQCQYKPFLPNQYDLMFFLIWHASIIIQNLRPTVSERILKTHSSFVRQAKIQSMGHRLMSLWPLNLEWRQLSAVPINFGVQPWSLTSPPFCILIKAGVLLPVFLLPTCWALMKRAPWDCTRGCSRAGIWPQAAGRQPWAITLLTADHNSVG